MLHLCHAPLPYLVGLTPEQLPALPSPRPPRLYVLRLDTACARLEEPKGIYTDYYESTKNTAAKIQTRPQTRQENTPLPHLTPCPPYL